MSPRSRLILTAAPLLIGMYLACVASASGEEMLGRWCDREVLGLAVKSIFRGLEAIGLVSQRVVTGADRNGPSLWQILSAHGLRSIVINYMISWPAEEIEGIFISQYLFHERVKIEKIQPMRISPTMSSQREFRDGEVAPLPGLPGGSR